MSFERRDEMLAAVEPAGDGRERLRLVVQRTLNEGVADDALLET
ncbi:hypothetical protein ACQPYH_35455 [Kribbella sp. CA-245084]